MEQPTEIYRCARCGTSLNSIAPGALCPGCASLRSGATGETVSGQPASYVESPSPSAEHGGEDPDRPRWSVATGIGVWIFSIAVLLGVQLVAILAWALLSRAAGQEAPLDNRQEFLTWLESPQVVLVSVASSVAGHVLTLAVCWAVVTRIGRASLLKGLGWSWKGPPVLIKALFVIGTTLLMLAIFFALDRWLPTSRETAFDRLLKTSQEVRVAIALLAVFSAPIVEEVVYRGVLYSALRSRIGVVGAVVIVTSLFGSVHFVQYWGAWSSIIGVTLLSFVLTVIRAATKSIKPCVAIHLLNNVVGAVGILSGPSHG